MKKRRTTVKLYGAPPEAEAPSPFNELEEAAELLEQQEPPLPSSFPASIEDTDPLLLDPAD